MSPLIPTGSCAITILSFALAGVGAAATPTAVVGAESAAWTTSSVTVHYDDLNLATRAGVRALQSRLQQAAQVVCGNDSSRDLERTSRERACRETAVARAMRQIAPQIAAAQASRVKAG